MVSFGVRPMDLQAENRIHSAVSILVVLNLPPPPPPLPVRAYYDIRRISRVSIYEFRCTAPMITAERYEDQTCSAFYVVLVTSAKVDLHERKVKFNTQN
jgi:hypothetical protein